MPNLALAPSPASSPAALVNAAAATGTADPAAAGADAGAAPSFGTLLEKQIATQAGSDCQALVIDLAQLSLSPSTTDDAAPLDPASLAALLPEMFGMPGNTVPGKEAPADDMTVSTPPLATDAGLPIAAALTPAQPLTANAPKASGGGENQTNPAAIVAAAEAETGKAFRNKATADDAAALSQPLTRESPEGAAAAQQIQAPPAATPAHVSARIEAPVGTPRWNNEFSDRLAWMVGRNESRAELVLNPPQMGRIEVSLSVAGDQANAVFVAASQSTRDAIENALPRLREVLAEAGIQLGQAQVGSESPQQSPNHKENKDNVPHGLALGQDGKPVPPGFAVNSPTAWLRSGRGMLDVFA